MRFEQIETPSKHKNNIQKKASNKHKNINYAGLLINRSGQRGLPCPRAPPTGRPVGRSAGRVRRGGSLPGIIISLTGTKATRSMRVVNED